MASKTKKASRNINYGERVGANVRGLRKLRRMTQNEVADAAGLSRATVAGLEGGKYESVELSTIGALAEALGVGEDELIRTSEPPDSATIENFRHSPWFAAVRPTAEEMTWLAHLPKSFWAPPLTSSPKALFELLEFRRRQL